MYNVLYVHIPIIICKLCVLCTGMTIQIYIISIIVSIVIIGGIGGIGSIGSIAIICIIGIIHVFTSVKQFCVDVLISNVHRGTNSVDYITKCIYNNQQ